MSTSIEAFFLNVGSGPSSRRFCIHTSPTEAAPRAALVYLHPFGEEMNKSRRMVALQARALASAGFAVLQVDLKGCGDSDGELGDVTWDDWVEDGLEGWRWLGARHGVEPWLWALRGGTLVAASVAARLPRPPALLLWQPVIQGRMLLQQFMRLSLASGLADGAGKAILAEQRRELEAGRSVDIAGYRLSPSLADGFARAILSANLACPKIAWLEVSNKQGSELMPTSQALVSQIQRDGHLVHAKIVPGPAFWQTVEIEEAPALLSATLKAMSELSAP